ncbi:MAG: DNA-directed RNA polymerase subunit omega [Oscillospiraceae bacterium]|jgi:DNA-directed RNA polymerase subunit omega|nr:DNA-directed RNA polymerase subunit omega [Oscillospiraceae bacterium]
MMLYPPLSDLVHKIGSRYLLVNLIARRARELSSDAEDGGLHLDKKPVSTAIDEVYTGKIKPVGNHF